MKTLVLFLLGLLAVPLVAQAPPAKADPFGALAFLQGSWEAKTSGANGVDSVGVYSFGPELKNHVFARHALSVAGCKGPADFVCQHGYLLYVYQDAPGQPLKAIYMDNEGHVIHYSVSTPEPATAVFLSDASQPGPQFRLVYELKNGVMAGRFQVRMPDGAEWHSYLEWSGGRKG